VEEDRLISLTAENVYFVTDNRVDRRKVTQKIKAKKSTVVAAGGDQTNVEVPPPDAAQERASTSGLSFAILIIIVGLIGIVIAGLLLGLFHVIDWKLAAIPIVLGALAAIGSLAAAVRS
jgi:hypothetical protein